MTEFQTIAKAKNMRTGINIKATVKSKGTPRHIDLRTGGFVNVCDFIISDSTGDVKFKAWGEDIDVIGIGDTIHILNGYTNEFKGEVSITKGKFGKMEINPPI